jgi:hypothetical protein
MTVISIKVFLIPFTLILNHHYFNIIFWFWYLIDIVFIDIISLYFYYYYYYYCYCSDVIVVNFLQMKYVYCTKICIFLKENKNCLCYILMLTMIRILIKNWFCLFVCEEHNNDNDGNSDYFTSSFKSKIE